MKRLELGALVLLLMLGLVFMGCTNGMDPIDGDVGVIGGEDGNTVVVLPSVPADYQKGDNPGLTADDINDLLEQAGTYDASKIEKPAGGYEVYLKGTGKSFNSDGWQNLFVMIGDYEEGSVPNTWHLVYSGDFSDVLYMQVTFTNGTVFKWVPDMGPSVNGGGNNPGWVIVAPYDWAIAYVEKGNNGNKSDSYIKSSKEFKAGGQFNISGYNAGKAAPPPSDPEDPPPDDPNPPPTTGDLAVLDVIDDLILMEEYYIDYHKPVYQKVGNGESTIINRYGTTLTGANNTHFSYIEVGKDTTELAIGNKKNPIGISYEIEIIDNELYIYFADHYELIGNASLRAIVSNDAIPDKHNTYGNSNGQHLSCGVGFENAYKAIKWGENVDLSGAKPIYLFVHFADGLWFYDHDQVIGCVLHYTDGPFIRDYTGPALEPADYLLNVTITRDCMEPITGGLGTYENLQPGTYTVTIFWGDVEIAAEEIDVVVGKTVTVDFGELTIPIEATGFTGDTGIVCPWFNDHAEE